MTEVQRDSVRGLESPLSAGDSDAVPRVGSVPYLNARPLVWGLDEVEFAVPSVLARRFAAGAYAAALVPIFAAFELGAALVVDDVAIACDGEVFSVILAHREPLTDVRSVVLDGSSRTSVNLLQCVLGEFYGMTPRYVTEIEAAEQARLIIGDPAIAFRRSSAADGWSITDLGAEWKRHTGLPFVFAAWVLGGGVGAEVGVQLADRLRAAKQAGLAGRESIASAEADPAFARDYLTRYIRFGLGPAEKRSIGAFAAMCRRRGLLTVDAPRLEYV